MESKRLCLQDWSYTCSSITSKQISLNLPTILQRHDTVVLNKSICITFCLFLPFLKLMARKEQNIFPWFIETALVVNSFWHHEAELQYQYNCGEKNCLIIIGKNLFAPLSKPLTFFFSFFDHCNWHDFILIFTTILY